MSCGLHDVARLEAAGIPTAFLVTTAFVESVAEQLPILGMAGYQPVWVPHPIAALDPASLAPIAARAAEGVAAVLSGARPPQLATVTEGVIGSDADCGEVACAVDLVESGRIT